VWNNFAFAWLLQLKKSINWLSGTKTALSKRHDGRFVVVTADYVNTVAIQKLGRGFVFAFYGAILYRLRDIASYW